MKGWKDVGLAVRDFIVIFAGAGLYVAELYVAA